MSVWKIKIPRKSLRRKNGNCTGTEYRPVPKTLPPKTKIIIHYNIKITPSMRKKSSIYIILL